MTPYLLFENTEGKQIYVSIALIAGFVTSNADMIQMLEDKSGLKGWNVTTVRLRWK